MYSNVKFIEDALSRKLNKVVEIKKQSFYTDGDFSTFARIFVDGREVKIKVDFYDLTEYHKRGILPQQLSRLAAKIQETL